MRKNARRKVHSGKPCVNACAARVYDDVNNNDARSEIGRGPTMSQRYPSILIYNHLRTGLGGGEGVIRNGQVHSDLTGNKYRIDIKLFKAQVCLEKRGIKRIQQD